MITVAPYVQRPKPTMTSGSPGALATALAALLAGLLTAPVSGPLAAQSPPDGAGPAGVNGRPIVQAARTSEPIRVDAVLDEPVWQTITPISGFLQRVPVDGAPASERTEVRIAFDEGHLYFGLTLHDSEPLRIRRSILHRDGGIDQDDNVRIALDTYHDGRNAYIFELNPFGTQGDAHFTDESLAMSDWNWEGVYESEARITEDGWVLEVAIPFTTIRFSEDDAPDMGILIERTIRRKNELVYFPHVGQQFRSGLTQVSQYATLSGLEQLRRGRYMEVKPFAIAGRQSLPGTATQTLNELGLDFKYSITSNLTLDATVNPDFAQVEADNVQVNLTRFNLFFPEKREFFLERAGLFAFGDGGETEIFFSRRIGIRNDIVGGGRLTGQTGRFSIGALSLFTDDARDAGGNPLPGGVNSVVRLRMDALPRTTIGGIVTSLDEDAGSNRVAGADAQVRFGSASSFNAWFASVSDSEAGSSAAGSAALELRNDRALLSASYTGVDADFDPSLGFVRRRDMRRWKGGVAAFPRFEQSRWARRMLTALNTERITGGNGDLQSTLWLSHNMFTFESSDWVMLNLRRRFERLTSPSAIQGRALAQGDYTFSNVELRVQTDESRTLSPRARLTVGDFWNGTRTEIGGGVAWKTGPYLTLGTTVTRNDISLPVENGDFSTTLVSLNVLGAISRSLFANALVQFDDVSNVVQANLRINWIHTPGSDLFLVFDTGYLTGDLLEPRDRWERRTGVVKLTYLKAF